MLDECSMSGHAVSWPNPQEMPAVSGQLGGMAHVSQIELGCRRFDSSRLRPGTDEIEAQSSAHGRRLCAGP